MTKRGGTLLAEGPYDAIASFKSRVALLKSSYYQAERSLPNLAPIERLLENWSSKRCMGKQRSDQGVCP